MRNNDYAKIVRQLRFHTSASKATDTEVDAAGNVRTSTLDSEGRTGPASDDELARQWGAGMREAEVLVWMGDFNYR